MISKGALMLVVRLLFPSSLLIAPPFNFDYALISGAQFRGPDVRYWVLSVVNMWKMRG
jgi:hypothetical protein